MIQVKIKITSIGNQWLLSKEHKGSYIKAGKIKSLLNKSANFLFNDFKVELTIREIENAKIFNLQADGVTLKLSLSKNKPVEILTWKSNNDENKLKCYSKSTYYYITYNDSKIAKMKVIADNHFIFEILSTSNFQPIVLLASLYPFF